MIFDNNVKSVWNQNERKQLILTDDHNTFSTTNWVDLTLNRWGQKRTHAKIHPDEINYCRYTYPPFSFLDTRQP